MTRGVPAACLALAILAGACGEAGPGPAPDAPAPSSTPDARPPALLPPVLMEAAGRPIEAEGGCAAPFAADIDGDGDLDLLVGQLAGKSLVVYRNEGSARAPRLAAGTRFRAGGRDAGLPGPERAGGFRPRVADLDGDGLPDILSGSWPGEIFLFRGAPGGAFLAAAKIRGRDGRSLNIGGGVEEHPMEGRIVRGDAEVRVVDGRRLFVYEGEVVDPGPLGGLLAGTDSTAHPFDWDGDGDLDLLVGDDTGQVHLVPNLGTAREWAFGEEVRISAGGAEVLAPGGSASPFVADWDGDGLPDLLLGAADGSVSWFRNEGTRTAPRLGPARAVLPAGTWGDLRALPGDPVRGKRAVPCAVDWNGDGRLDLLVGDFEILDPRNPVPSKEEAEEHARLRAERAAIIRETTDLLAAMRATPPPPLEERVRAKARVEVLTEKSRELWDRLPRVTAPHGAVWFLEGR